MMLPNRIGYPFDAALRLLKERQPAPAEISAAMSVLGLRAQLTHPN
ncbi:hypothetical protein AB0O34_30210 [Sphaerisporangium sp. NPDC088356]